MKKIFSGFAAKIAIRLRRYLEPIPLEQEQIVASSLHKASRNKRSIQGVNEDDEYSIDPTEQRK
jgi:hypothetical protein